MNPRVLLILFVGVAAMIEDLGWRRISNWTSGGALLAGLAVHLYQSGWQGLLHSLAGAAIGFGVFLIFYILGGMGGGDVKLMAGFGALLGDRQVLPAALLAAIAGAVMAVIYLGVRKLRSKGAGEGKTADSIPYAPALAAGAWLALVSEL